MPESITGRIALWTYLVGFWCYLFLRPHRRGRACPSRLGSSMFFQSWPSDVLACFSCA